MMNPGTPWLREQIIAAIREFGVSSTSQIAARLPVERIARPCMAHNPFGCRSSLPNFICHDGVHTFDYPRQPSDIYRHLRAMENQGVVSRETFGAYSHGPAFWMLTDPGQAQREIDTLNEMMARS